MGKEIGCDTSALLTLFVCKNLLGKDEFLDKIKDTKLVVPSCVIKELKDFSERRDTLENKAGEILTYGLNEVKIKSEEIEKMKQKWESQVLGK